MRRIRFTSIVVIAATVVAVGAGTALAEAPATLDCKAHGKLTQQYTVAELKDALATMPQTDIEYTNCYQVIKDQLNHQLGGTPVSGSGSASSGGSFLSAPVIIVLIVIVLAGGGFALAARKRSAGGGGDDAPPPPTAG